MTKSSDQKCSTEKRSHKKKVLPLLIVSMEMYSYGSNIAPLAQGVYESYVNRVYPSTQRIELPDMYGWEPLAIVNAYVEAMNTALESSSDLMVLLSPKWETTLLGDLMSKIVKCNKHIKVLDGNTECDIPVNILRDVQTLKEVSILGNLLFDLSDHVEPNKASLELFWDKMSSFESLESISVMKALSYGRTALPKWFLLELDRRTKELESYEREIQEVFGDVE